MGDIQMMRSWFKALLSGKRSRGHARRNLRPDDWWLIWPELAEKEAA